MAWFARIWAENKRFITTVGAGLAVFLLLDKIGSAILGDAEGIRERTRKETREVMQLAADLRTFSRDQLDAEALAKQEASAIAKLTLPDPKDVPVDKGFTIAFIGRRDRIYNDALNEARKRNIELPPKARLDFPIADSDPVEKLAARWIHLGVAERVLREAVAIGFRRIADLSPLETEFRPIPGAGGKGILFYPIRVALHGEFADFVSFFDTFQKEGNFLSLRLEALGPDPAGGLAGRIVASGMRLSDAPPSQGTRRTPGSIFEGRR